MRRSCTLAVFAAALAVLADRFASPAAAAPTPIAVTVDGVRRTALVEPGRAAVATPSPLVIYFHGLGGNSHEGFDLGIAKAWPEATVVCPQGLRIPTPEAGGGSEIGWQLFPGERNDEDIRFVEALIQQVGTTHSIDERRVYATGFSRGAIFCELLLATRPQLFAAFAPVSGFSAPHLRWASLPRAVLITHGANDDTVPLSLAELVRDHIRRVNGCSGTPVPWGQGAERPPGAARGGAPVSILYPPDTTGPPLVWSLH